MLVPAYFIVGGWDTENPIAPAFKLFIFTHAGAVFVLWESELLHTHRHDDMFAAQAALTSIAPDLVKWFLSP